LSGDRSKDVDVRDRRGHDVREVPHPPVIPAKAGNQ
jgi:hypothetical protein